MGDVSSEAWSALVCSGLASRSDDSYFVADFDKLLTNNLSFHLTRTHNHRIILSPSRLSRPLFFLSP